MAGGLNLYGYANGDPINFSDPFGLDACKNDDGETYVLCDAVRELVITWLEQLESDRETRNAGAPTDEAVAQFLGQLMGPPQDLLHQDGAPPRENKYVIYVDAIASQESVFSGGQLVTDPAIRGSFNYVTPLPASHFLRNPSLTIGTWAGHFLADMVPPALLSRLRRSKLP